MKRLSPTPATERAPWTRVRIVNVRLKARRWAIAGIALATSAAVVVPLLVNQHVISAGLWLIAAAVPPVACAAISLFFYRTEEPQQRRVFD